MTSKAYTTVVPLTAGRTYTFKVEARNNVGYSISSTGLAVLAAQIPDTPVAPTTAVSSSNVVISWTLPGDGSTPITGYKVEIRHSDNVSFSTEPNDCNMQASTLLTCSVPISTLLTSPFSLLWGSSIYARVSAINIVGTSMTSASGNGAIILTNPSPPTSLANVASITSKSQIGLIWNTVTFSGGTPVIDYQLTYSIDAGAYSVLASGLLLTSFTANGLTAGSTYNFKVQARNSFGLSIYSNVVSILAA